MRLSTQLLAPDQIPSLNIDLSGVIVNNTEVRVYKVDFKVVPAAHQADTFNIATSATQSVVVPWGMN